MNPSTLKAASGGNCTTNDQPLIPHCYQNYVTILQHNDTFRELVNYFRQIGHYIISFMPDIIISVHYEIAILILSLSLL